MMSGERDGNALRTDQRDSVAGKREANLRASSNSLPFRAWIQSALLWWEPASKLDKKVAFSYLFVVKTRTKPKSLSDQGPAFLPTHSHPKKSYNW